MSLNTSLVEGGPVTWTLYDTAATLAQLDLQRSAGDAAGIALHNDLGSGVSYGSRNYSLVDNYVVRTVALNASALSAIQGASGGRFTLGGMVTSPIAAVPEPATWGLMILGFVAVGGSLRRRRGMRLRFA